MKTRELWKHLTPEERELAQKQFLAHPTRADKRMERELRSKFTLLKQIQQSEVSRQRRQRRRIGGK